MSVTPPQRGGSARQSQLLAATIDVLRETGYDRFTVDAVAARARASKATVYRRWPSKADLAVAAFAHAISEIVPVQHDTGSLRGDFTALLDGLLTELESLGDVISGLIGELRRNPELAAAMRDGYIDSRRRAAFDVLERARERGEVKESVDLDLLWQLAPAALFFRVLLADEPVDRAFVRKLVDEVVVPLAGGPVA